MREIYNGTDLFERIMQCESMAFSRCLYDRLLCFFASNYANYTKIGFIRVHSMPLLLTLKKP